MDVVQESVQSAGSTSLGASCDYCEAPILLDGHPCPCERDGTFWDKEGVGPS